MNVLQLACLACCVSLSIMTTTTGADATFSSDMKEDIERSQHSGALLDFLGRFPTLHAPPKHMNNLNDGIVLFEAMSEM